MKFIIVILLAIFALSACWEYLYAYWWGRALYISIIPLSGYIAYKLSESYEKDKPPAD